MLGAPKDPARLHNLDEWWIERRLLARKMIDIGEYRTAYLIARDAALPSRDIYKTEQEFTAGWIALRFLNDPAVGRAAFCPHRRRQRQPDRAGARRLLAGPRRGSRGPRPGGPRRLCPRRRAIDQLLRPAGARETRTAADRTERRPARPRPRRRTAGDRARGRNCSTSSTSARSRSRSSPTWARTAIPTRWSGSANWPSRYSDARGMLLLGKAALNRGLPFDFYAYPVNGIPPFKAIGPEVEQSIVYAIARQESAFNPAVVSPAQAYGLMQVTPDAGRYVCKRSGADFDLSRMKTDPVYNAALGAAELGGLIEDYRGSYIMTFAAYNAGRGSVKKWIERYGDPRDPKVDAVDWVELIPFSETRNYVQRIMENLQVYRARFGGGTRLQIEADLHRGASVRVARRPPWWTELRAGAPAGISQSRTWVRQASQGHARGSRTLPAIMQRNPRQFPAGILPLARRSGSEVTLGAHLQVHRVLIPELVDGRRLRRRRPQGRGTREFLVEVEPLHFGRERQVLDRRPADVDTELRDVVVRVAAVVRADGLGRRRVVRADDSLCRCRHSGPPNRLPNRLDDQYGSQLWLNAPRMP